MRSRDGIDAGGCTGILVVAVVLCLVVPGLGHAKAERRVALVIGNGAYATAPLANPVNDSADMAAALRGLGFEVIHRKNASHSQMEQALREFGRRIQRGGIGLFYYAGHGVQVEGRNYLLPVSTDIESVDEIRFKALDAAQVLAKMQAANNGFNMVFLDACRNDPFGSRGFRGSLDRGLAVIRYPRGTLISYATDPGDVAADGSSGRNSPYTKHLLAAIRKPGLKVEDALKQMANGVVRETGGRQRPWMSSSLLDDFYFAGRETPGPPSPGGGDFSIDDLERQAEWQSWLAGMSGAFESARSLEEKPGSAELKAKAWQRFIDAYPEDDRYSQQDESMRRTATEQLARWSTAVAYLVVRSNVAGDHLYIDDRAVGATSAARHQLEPGRHSVRVEKEGYSSFREQVTLSGEETRTLHASLVQEAGDTAVVPGDMVVVPAGDFYYGCNERVDSECDGDEKPGRTRSLGAFRIDRTEVTVAAYGECVDAGGCSEPDASSSCNWEKAGRDDHPINCVDWHQAAQYCEWRGARLPTEVEWEKAARGTDGRKYPWGNRGYDGGARVANISGDDDGYSATAPVGSFPRGASPYGALDMMGNVWEWTSDWYGPSRQARVLRGGSWRSLPGYARASARLRYDPRGRNLLIGFRCAQ